MSNLIPYADSIAETIADYRADELTPRPDRDHVIRWIEQFDAPVREPMLAEINHVFNHLYFNPTRFRTEMAEFAVLPNDGRAYWESAVPIGQAKGRSQQELLPQLREEVLAKWGVAIPAAHSEGENFFYLDDFSFSANHLGNDLEQWVHEEAPLKARLTIRVSVAYEFGSKKALGRISAAAKASKKSIQVAWVPGATFQRADVLWPATIPSDSEVKAHVAGQASLTYPFKPRDPHIGKTPKFFTGEKGRALLENEFLIAGVRILKRCATHSPMLRPLGYGPFELGFGSLVVSHRNCPNACPLALWWGDTTQQDSGALDWYPLLPRRI